MPKIGEKPEKTTLDGTEKFPLTGSVWAYVSRLVAYLSGEGTLATKSYVDGIAANLGKRQRVRVATTANITIATALNNGDTLDGVSLATGDLVLVKNQSAAAENGVYVVGASPARFAEFDTYDEHPGSLIAVQEGTTNADTAWLCTSNVGGTLNTTAIDFSALSTGGSVSDAAYGSGWNGDTTNAPSRNAVYDKIESMGSGGGGMNSIFIFPDYYVTKSGTWGWITSYQYYNLSHANGNYLTYDVYLNAGTYDLYFEHAINGDRAIADFLIDGTSIGTIDTNGSNTDHVVGKITGFTVATGGLKVLKLLVNGHTGSDYYLVFQHIYLVQKS